MTPLVTIEEASEHLRIDGTADDPWLEVMIPAISAAVLSWLKDPLRAYETEEDSNGDVVLVEDSNGDNVPLGMAKAACLVELGMQYRFREGTGSLRTPDSWGRGYVLGAGATSLLFSLRKPTVA